MGAILDTGGEFTATAQRLRKGIVLNETGGMSYGADLQSGGASYFFTRIIPQGRTATGIRFKAGNLARQDAISYERDMFGKVTDANEIAAARKINPQEWRKAAGMSRNETIFKNNLSIDDISRIVVGMDYQRLAVIKAFHDRGIYKLADGRKIEDVVITAAQLKK